MSEVNNSLSTLASAFQAGDGKSIQRIKYPCGCEQIGFAPLSKECPTHGLRSEQEIMVAVILDESSSMSSCREQTINGYNEYLDGLKKDGKPYLITLSKFDFCAGSPTCRIQCKNLPVDKVEPLTKKTYAPRGSTPLYDAIGETVQSIGIESNGRAVLVLILTDGQENSSKEWNQAKIKALIAEKEALGNWTFVYLGANQDAWDIGQQFGMHAGNVVNFATANVGNVMSNLVRSTAMYANSVQNGNLCSTSYFQDAGLSDDNINKNPAAVTLGSLGGKATAAGMTEEEKKLRAKKANLSRSIYKP